MPQPSSRRYLKAQLRPLTKPTFWASAGLFLLSLVALASLFAEPDKVLSNGDRDAVVNLDNNESLTPEERARAAEIDDLSVLLKDLDERGTIDFVSGRLNEQQPANLDTPEVLQGLNSSNQKPSVSAVVSNSEFQQLPLLDLNPRQVTPSQTGQIVSASGFIGFDPRSSGQVDGLSMSGSATAVTPLAAALERNSAQRNVQPGDFGNNSATDSFSNTGGDISSGSRDAVTNQPLSNGALETGISNLSPNLSPNMVTPNLSTPNYGNLQSLTPQNSSNNAYSQILNPNLVVPTTPTALPTLPNSQLPVPVAPALPVVSPSLGQVSPSGTTTGTGVANGSSVVAPFAASSPQDATFGAPTANNPVPTLTNPAPFSIPNTTPNQAIGNGKINTFANP